MKSQLDILDFCLTSCVSRICYFRLCLFEHSYLHKGLEHCVWEYIRPKKIVHHRRWWYPFHLLLLVRLSQEMIVVKGCLIKYTSFSRGFFYAIKAQGLRNIPAPPIIALMDFYYGDAETNAHSLPVPWFFISSSLWLYLCKCMYILSILCLVEDSVN